MGITITEALAEIKTIGKRIEKKQQFIQGYIARQDGVRDPLEKDGGSVEVIARELQAISDLETRLISLRRNIQKANDETAVPINGITRTISEWLTWRRDVAPKQRQFFSLLQQTLNSIRDQAQQKGNAIVSATAISSDIKPTDIVVNISEADLATQQENLEDILGQLDGQLSLKNATVVIE